MFTVDVCDHEKQYTIYWLICGNWREIPARESDIYARQKSKTLPSQEKKPSFTVLCALNSNIFWFISYCDFDCKSSWQKSQLSGKNPMQFVRI